MMADSIAQTFGDFVTDLEESRIPDDVLETARLALLHNVSVAVASGRLSMVADRWARGRWGGAGSRAFLSGIELSPPDAAFVNGCLIHARAQDDTYFPGLTHVGAATTPAVLALAEHGDATIRDVLVALVAGYEVAAAAGVVSAATTTALGFRASGIYGVLGAAAGAAKVFALDRNQAAHAVAIAASSAAGTNQTWVDGSSEWQLQLGGAARAGLEAAAAAACGANGAANAFEGVSGFYQAFAHDSNLASGVGQRLGSHWSTRDVTFKAHPVCAILQGPVAAARALSASAPESEFARATLHLTPAEANYPGTVEAPPFDDAGAALMSASYCVSLALASGSFTADDLFRSHEEVLQEQARRVQVVADPSLRPRCFVLEVEWAEGRVDRVEQDGSGAGRWSRDELLANLARLQDEIPAGVSLDRLIGTTFGSLDAPAAAIVDATVVA